MLRKLYYDKSADLAVTDHIVSTMISQSHQAAAAAVAVSPLVSAIIKNRPNQEILICDWLITSHVT